MAGMRAFFPPLSAVSGTNNSCNRDST